MHASSHEEPTGILQSYDSILWSRRGSNALPPPCHGGALPIELRPLDGRSDPTRTGITWVAATCIDHLCHRAMRAPSRNRTSLCRLIRTVPTTRWVTAHGLLTCPIGTHPITIFGSSFREAILTSTARAMRDGVLLVVTRQAPQLTLRELVLQSLTGPAAELVGQGSELGRRVAVMELELLHRATVHAPTAEQGNRPRTILSVPTLEVVPHVGVVGHRATVVPVVGLEPTALSLWATCTSNRALPAWRKVEGSNPTASRPSTGLQGRAPTRGRYLPRWGDRPGSNRLAPGPQPGGVPQCLRSPRHPGRVSNPLPPP